MKSIIILILVLFSFSYVHGQTLAEKIAINACEKLDSIDNFSVLEDSIKSSVASALAKVMMEGTPEEKKQISSIEGIRIALEEAVDVLPNYCYNVRRLVIENKKTKYYGLSDNSKANINFAQGNEYLNANNLKKAGKAFKSAIKLDEGFVYAIDHLAISYRRQQNFKSAIKLYQESLEIFPEGNLALLNIAVCYSSIGDYRKSIESYEKLKFYYPKDPEGYFGLARMQFMDADYENGLDNLFIAHRIYVETNSDYQKDSSGLISLYSERLTELGKLDLIEKKAMENNITIGK